jgi:polar amino acid transport system substrate-binding protein
MFKISLVRIFAVLFMLIPNLGMADVIEDILLRGTLRVGVAKFVPWVFETNSGELNGFDIDVGRKIAKDMGVSAEFKVYMIDDMIAALNNGAIDVIATGLAITPSRALKFNFTIPYMESGVGIATNIELTKDIKSFSEMNKSAIIISTVKETLASEFGKTLFDKAKLIVFESQNEAETAVLEGKAHAYLASMPEVRFFSLRNKATIDLPMKKPLLASKAGLGVKKGNQEWLNFLNSWITAHHANLWLSSTHSYWFGSLDWVKDLKQ